MSFILILPPQKKLCKLVQAASLTCVVIWGFLHRSAKAAGSISAGHPISLLVTRLGSHETQEPGRSALRSSLPKQPDMVHAPPQMIHGEIILTTELVLERGLGGNSFPLCVQNHSNTRQAEARFLVIHLRSRMFSSSPKFINCYLCEIILQAPGWN